MPSPLASRIVVPLVLLLVLVTVDNVAASRGLRPRGVMPWMCLERCGNTTRAGILETIGTLAKHRAVIAGVSFERFNLGPNSTLIVDTDLTNVGPILRAEGFTTVPMVSSWPHPPQFLDWMRQVFANPEVFIVRLMDALIAEDLDGVNIDWEPTTHATPSDAIAYAAFLRRLRDRVASIGRFVSADVATWNGIWNLSAINASMAADPSPETPRGYVATMNTYALPEDLFASELQTAVANFDNESLIVGMETWPGKVDAVNVTRRFTEIARTSVPHVALWRCPLPDFWWVIIHRWFNFEL